MPKRKHSEIEDIIDKIEDRAIRIKASRLHAKIDHGNKSLKDALSLARGFERQKMGRRQKKASNEPHTLLRLREEVIVLKELDLASTAHDYLFKQLAKTKRVRESAAFVALYGEDPRTAAPKNNAEANVLGRLFKANPVMEILPGILEGIKQVLNLDDTKSASGKETKNRAVRPEEGQANGEVINIVNMEEDFEGFSDGVVNEEGDSIGSSDGLDEAELALYNDRLAASSDDEGDESEHDLDPMEISDVEDQTHNDQDSLSISLSTNSEDEEEQKSNTQSQRPAPPPPPPSEKISKTAFLPSLSVGGYYSGSESDNDDDIYNEKRGPAIPKDRKNRRGQRERQKLAELKYGKNAKHLQKQQPKGKEGRNSGWDAKRGAVEGSGYDVRQRRTGKGGFARTKGPTGANADSVSQTRTVRNNKPAAKKSEGPLHPSWEAAKKKKQENGKTAFAGKKITFD